MRTLQPALIVALDNLDPKAALALQSELAGVGVSWFKVGFELFTRGGPSLVDEIKRRDARVFLDLKLHDIPHTVSNAVRAASGLGVDLMTVHVSGGNAMLESASAASGQDGPRLVGVTALTSLSAADLAGLAEAWGARAGSRVSRGAVTLRLAEMACRAGLNGVVCSASDLNEGAISRLAWKAEPRYFVTPGIRPGGMPGARDDQRSVATATQAVAAGATHLVVGRPITAPPQGTCGSAAQLFLKEIHDAHANHS